MKVKDWEEATARDFSAEFGEVFKCRGKNDHYDYWMFAHGFYCQDKSFSIGGDESPISYSDHSYGVFINLKDGTVFAKDDHVVKCDYSIAVSALYMTYKDIQRSNATLVVKDSEEC